MNTWRQVATRVLLLVLQLSAPHRTCALKTFSASRNAVRLAPDARTTCEVALQAVIRAVDLHEFDALAQSMTNTPWNAKDHTRQFTYVIHRWQQKTTLILCHYNQLVAAHIVITKIKQLGYMKMITMH